MTRIGINGFGRIGRLALRAAWDRDDLAFVHVNEVKGGPQTAAHLLEFDSVHGKWTKQIGATETTLTVEGHEIVFTEAMKPGDVSWEDSAVDIVLECSGKMLTREALAPYFERGVKKVIVVMEHSSKNGDPKFIPACTLPLTGKNVVDMVITDLAVFQRPDHQSPFKLIEMAPGVTADEIAAKTTAQYAV